MSKLTSEGFFLSILMKTKILRKTNVEKKWIKYMKMLIIVFCILFSVNVYYVPTVWKWADTNDCTYKISNQMSKACTCQ